MPEAAHRPYITPTLAVSGSDDGDVDGGEVFRNENGMLRLGMYLMLCFVIDSLVGMFDVVVLCETDRERLISASNLENDKEITSVVVHPLQHMRPSLSLHNQVA